MNQRLILISLVAFLVVSCAHPTANEKPRVIVTSDGEIDDQCSMIRFMLYANE